MLSRCEICCEIVIAILLLPLGVCVRHGCCTISSLSFSSVFFIFCYSLTIFIYWSFTLYFVLIQTIFFINFI
ncbi:unnamed protein product [Malus baccata var. baccata]